MEKKGGVIVTVLVLIIVILVLVIAGIFLIYMPNKVENEPIAKQQSEKTGEKEIKEEDITGSKIESNLFSNFEYALATFYYGEIKTENIPSEYIVDVAMKNMNYNLAHEDYYYKAEDVKEKIKEIFGNVAYKDNSLLSDEWFQHPGTGYEYNEEEDIYELFEGGGGVFFEIVQLITKSVKKGEYIEIYVNPVFIEDFATSEDNMKLYNNIDYKNQRFINKLGEIKANSYDKTKIANSIDTSELDTYKYVFKLDQSSEEYYFYEFVKVK